MFNQHNLWPLLNEFARCQNRFFDVIYRMLTEYFQLNQIRRNDIAGRQTVPYMKLCDTRCNDTAFFRMTHYRIAKIFRLRIRCFHLTDDTEDMFTLLRRSQIAT
ncbi:Uncharacterised protein [Shigella flexneri]|nr:Uncharacterised protein [Shigella flexneri]